MKVKILLLVLGILFLLTNCNKDTSDDNIDYLTAPIGTTAIEASSQVLGDAAAGEEYMLYGNFISSGIPLEVAQPILAASADNNALGRTGMSANLPHEFNYVIHPNSTELAAPNCFRCHAQFLNGELVVGLGNSLSDFTMDQSAFTPLLDLSVQNFYGANSPAWEAYQPFRRATNALGAKIIADFKGVNMATRITGLLAQHRDPQTLEWNDEPLINSEINSLPSDVPAWWLLKKKNAMFVDGSGRGDFRKYLMGSALLTMEDDVEAAEILTHFDDVLAFLYSLEAPEYPNPIDQEKIVLGEDLFYKNCAKCHGTYGDEETYPNLLVDIDVVGTDPHYVNRNDAETNFIDWMNEGWIGKGADVAARLEYQAAYVAPPLDGVWATAPYLHNGSIPDLMTLLDSSQRPDFWQRDFDNAVYNMDKVGWEYEAVDAANSTDVYDTSKLGFGNQGHTYGDKFTNEERLALLEYLKTL